MATHSSIIAWRIPWTEEPGGLQSMGYPEALTKAEESQLTLENLQNASKNAKRTVSLEPQTAVLIILAYISLDPFVT